jgi:hypothetical protein
MLLTKDVFLDKILSDDKGHIITCNILDGLDKALYDKDFVKEVFDWWIDLCNHQGILSPNMILSVLNILVFENLPRGFRPYDRKPEFRLKCLRRINLTGKDATVTTIVSASIIPLLIRPEDLGTFAAKGVEFPSSGLMNDDSLDALTRLPETDRQVQLKDEAAIGGKKLAWISLANRLTNVLRRAPSPADEARDTLGLVHYERDVVLIALYYSAEVLDYNACARPTFADAGTHSRFKARADSAINRMRAAWGHTAHLGRFVRGERNIDGLPERVSSPIGQAAMTASPIITLIPLGRLAASRGRDVNDNDQKYAERLRAGRDKSELKSRMFGILS